MSVYEAHVAAERAATWKPGKGCPGDGCGHPARGCRRLTCACGRVIEWPEVEGERRGRRPGYGVGKRRECRAMACPCGREHDRAESSW